MCSLVVAGSNRHNNEYEAVEKITTTCSRVLVGSGSLVRISPVSQVAGVDLEDNKVGMLRAVRPTGLICAPFIAIETPIFRVNITKMI